MTAAYRERLWLRFLRGPDHALLDELYVPALSRARRYDRCCSYFNSGALAAAAAGFGELIQHLLLLSEAAPRPAIRLVVNEQLERPDVQAMLERGDSGPLEAKLLAGLVAPEDALVTDKIVMLGWLVREGFLDLRVGVMRNGGAIVHGKFGLVYDDAGEAVVFAGSGNETAAGLHGNYEQVEVSVSWDAASDARFDPMHHATLDRARLVNYEHEFTRLWESRHPYVATFDLPTAVRERLVNFAPSTAPKATEGQAKAIETARLAMLWGWAAEAPYLADGAETCDALMPVDLWPHQRRVVTEVAAAWPDGRLLCDEVGMGKTLEAIAILRRLCAGRGVHRALLLVPAGLLRQWQGELREKGGLVVPRLEGQTRLVWPDGTERPVAGIAEALREPILLVSREAARTESNRAALGAAEPFDLVLLDESHAARRAKSEEREFNSPNLLLGLLRELRAAGAARSVLLLSATPMQTQPWEPWDLLDVLGEGDPWLAEFSDVRTFYEAAAHTAAGSATDDEAGAAAELIRLDAGFPSVHGVTAGLPSTASIADLLSFPPPSERERLAAWMRRGSPLGRRMHRNTRATLRAYYEKGMLASPPPHRLIDDVRFDLKDPAERAAYDAVDDYIDRRYELLEAEKPGKGFVMTIYRRRAASSPQALERSLLRRREQLHRVVLQQATTLFFEAEEGFGWGELDEIDEELGHIPSGLPQTREGAEAEIAEIDGLLGKVHALPGDSKFEHFVLELKKVTDDGRAALVFTAYTDTMEYLRDLLRPVYSDRLACYSGDGGAVLRGGEWVTVSKTAITDALAAGRLRVLLCTDAASEGLNLQAAGALLNYDLPWNPARIEQRIGRIDRIGQALSSVRVVNLYLRDSVDDDVYRVLRTRCGLFEHFVGPMQPVLARARRMLLHQETVDLAALEAAAAQAAKDTLATETYAVAEAAVDVAARPGITRHGIEQLLRATAGRPIAGLRVSTTDHTATIAGLENEPLRVSIDDVALADDPTLQPISLVDGIARRIADRLAGGEGASPLVIGTAAEGGHRSAVAIWIGSDVQQPVDDFGQLDALLRAWDGTPVDPDRRYRALESARQRASELVRDAASREAAIQQEGARRRRGAARRRLVRELGRYLVAMGHGTDDLNGSLYRVMSGHDEHGRRARQAFERFGDYPEWSPFERRALARFDAGLTPNRRASRLSGMEVEAAVADPRWRQLVYPGEVSRRSEDSV